MFLNYEMFLFCFIFVLFWKRKGVGNYTVEPPGLFLGRGEHRKISFMFVRFCVYCFVMKFGFSTCSLDYNSENWLC